MMHPEVVGHNIFKQMSCKNQDKFYAFVKEIAFNPLVDDAPDHVTVRIVARVVMYGMYIYVHLRVTGRRLAVTMLEEQEIPCFDPSMIELTKIQELHYE